MEHAVHVMSKEAAAKYRADFLRATRKWSGETFQHFADDAAKQRHLDQVKEAQQAGAKF